jgi:hypothetical protein
MGIARENGYSASIEGFLVVADSRYRLAKTNGVTFVLAEPCALPPASEGELSITVDGQTDSKLVVLPDGAMPGQPCVRYEVVAPF